MRTKKAMLLATACCMAMTLAACGATAGESEGGTSTAAQTTIEVWDYEGQGVSNDAMEAAVAAFEKANPDISVKRTSFAFGDLSKSIVQGGVGGEVPDVAVIDTVDNQNFAALGLLKDITSDTQGFAEQFYPGPWASTQLEGKTYGLPMNSNNLALFYNTDMFEAAGINQAPTTWEELSEVALQLRAQGVSGLAISGIKNEQGTFQVLPFVWQTGGDVTDYDRSGGKALSYLKKLIDDGAMSSAVANYSQEDARTQFVTEKTAMMVNGPWEIGNLKEVSFAWKVAPLPSENQAATGMGGENIVVFEQAANPEAALKFVQFMASTQGVKTFCDVAGQLAPRPDLQGKLAFSNDENMRVFEAQMADAKARAYGANYAKISELIQISIQEALTGAKDAQRAATDAFAKIQPLLP